MRPSVSIFACLVVATSTVVAQNDIFMPASQQPDSNELNLWDDVPFMRANARVQTFYGPSEVTQTQFTASEAAFRYDGPIPRVGAPGPFTIRRFRLNVGTTTVSEPQPVFAGNVSQPLTNVFDGQVNYLPDQGTQIPEPWGGPQDALRFPFNAPVPINIPQNGWLLIEMIVQTNSNTALTHAHLDGELFPVGGPVDGTAQSSGAGCSSGPGVSPAIILTEGVHAPGAAHSIHGDNLGANAPVVALIGFSDTQGPVGSLPFTVPNTNCTVYTSWDFTLSLQADSLGYIQPFAANSMLPVPTIPALAGLNIYEQLASAVIGANPPWNLVFSDKRTVTLGTWTPPTNQVYQVSNKDFAGSPFADRARSFGYAIRMR